MSAWFEEWEVLKGAKKGEFGSLFGNSKSKQ